jgi:transcription termination/antitermination protein NusA
MRYFYDITNVECNDCILSDDAIAYLVKTGDMGKAIGKKGINIQKLKGYVKKNIFVFEEGPSEEMFIKKAFNVSSPVLQEMEVNNKKVVFIKLNASDKSTLRRGAIMLFGKEFFQRVYGKEIKIQSR